MSFASAGVSLTGLVLAISPLVLSSIKGVAELRHSALKYTKLYGPAGAWLPLLCSSDVWLLAEKILKTDNEKMVLSFVSAQIAQANMVAVTASALAGQL